TEYPTAADASGGGPTHSLDQFNGDGRAGTILDGEIAGVPALHASISSATNVRVGVEAFATAARAADVNPLAPNSGTITQVFTSPPTADLNASGGADIGEVLRSLLSRSNSGGAVRERPPPPPTLL